MIIVRWNVHTSNLNNVININDELPNSDLLKPNSTVVTCLSNTRTTAENHFQVNCVHCYKHN